MWIATNKGKTGPGHRVNPYRSEVWNPDADFVKLGIQLQDISNINAMIRKAQESKGSSSSLNQDEAKNLVEMLDKVCAFLRLPPPALNSRRSGRILRVS